MAWESSPAFIITRSELGEAFPLLVPLTSPRITPAATAVETLPAWLINSRRVRPAECAWRKSFSINLSFAAPRLRLAVDCADAGYSTQCGRQESLVQGRLNEPQRLGARAALL